MGVVYLSGFRTTPGRLADHQADAAEALTHLHRLGLRAANLQPIAGADIGTIATIVSVDSNAAYAAAFQTVMADEAWQEFSARVAAGGAATQVEATLLQDLDPAYEPGADRPLGVILAIQWQPKPGRTVDFVGNVMEALPHIERLGGSPRVMQSLLGPHPLTVMVSTSFADLDAYGAYADATNTDEQWQEFWGRAMADPTADIARSGLYVNMG